MKVNLPSLLHHPYLVCILFGMPSLHLFTFLMFFKSSTHILLQDLLHFHLHIHHLHNHGWLASEEVGHAYGCARNVVSRMVSKHSVATALEVRFCTCPVAETRSCRSIILGLRIVEMGPYCSCVSVALGSQTFAARAS